MDGWFSELALPCNLQPFEESDGAQANVIDGLCGGGFLPKPFHQHVPLSAFELRDTFARKLELGELGVKLGVRRHES